MRAFSHLSIRQQVIGLVLLASGLALGCVVAAAILYEATTFRPRVLNRLQQEVALLEIVLPPTFIFRDSETAAKYLSTAGAVREITVAAFYNREGQLFAQYLRPGTGAVAPVSAQPVGAQFAGRTLTLWHTIRQEDLVIGHLYILEDLPPLYARLPQYSLMAGAVLLALMIVATVLLRGVNRHVLHPLASLVGTADAVTRNHDYRVRAAVRRPDELGQLAFAFNQMLEVVGQRDAALRLSEERLHLATHATHLGIWDWDVVRNVLVWDESMYRLYGLRREDFAGAYEAWIRCVHPEDKDRVDNEIQAALRGDKEYAPEFRVVRPGGSVLFIQAASRTFRDPDGRPLRMIGTNLDVTARKQAEEALREAEETYRTVFQTSPDGMTLIDLEGRISFVSHKAMVIYGVDRLEDAVGHSIVEYIAPEDHARARQGFRETLQDRPVFMQPFRLRRLDGTCFAGEISTALLRDTLGQPKAVLAISRDITERQQAQRALEESRQLYGELVSSVPLGVYRLGLKSATEYRFEYVSDRFCEVTGLDRAAVLADARVSFTILHPDERDAFERLNAEALRSRGAFQWEGRAIIRGAPRWLRIESRPTLSSEQLPFWTGVVFDITERHATEDRLRQQAALLEASHDAILVWHVAAGIQFMNPAAEELTGQTFAQAQAQELAAVLRPRSDLALRGAIQEVTTHGAWSGELALQTGGGATRDVASRWTVLPDAQGQPTSVLITCNDITEKKQLETQYLRAQRLESVGTLASGVAHDLNNILSPLLMGVEMLHLSAADGETRSLLATMKESAQRGRDTVKQLLTFARGTESQKGPVQPRHLLKEIARLLLQTFPKNIQIYTDYAADLGTVLADPSQLHQVLMNLCVNARDAMPEGGVLFLTLENHTLDATTANLHPKARPIPYVVFKVSDSGTGIPPEVLDRIFDPFFTTKPQGKGTGLGLATVLGIVEGHGGFVTVESKLGQRTTFRVYLPVSATGETDSRPAETPAVSRGQGELILIVDDETAILRMAEGVLRRNGYDVITASSASEALHLFEQHHDQIRAVLTDIMMPFGDGRQLITMLYGQSPALPIVAMSGLASTEFQRETLRRGARAFVGKPFTSDQLLAALGDVLKPNLH